MERFEPALCSAFAQHPPGAHRFGEAFELALLQLQKIEQPAEQSARSGRYHDGSRLGELLQARGEVRRLADH